MLKNAVKTASVILCTFLLGFFGYTLIPDAETLQNTLKNTFEDILQSGNIIVNSPPEETFLKPVVDIDKSVPLTLVIPKIDVISSIEFVGKDSEERMDIPVQEENVAWYKYGPEPGTSGNSVIAGHFDSTTGPAVFYQLGNLTEGDSLFIAYSDGKTYEFEVSSVEVFEDTSFPIQRVFGSSDKKSLNLITCTGYFDPAERSYDKRLVVFSELVVEDVKESAN